MEDEKTNEKLKVAKPDEKLKAEIPAEKSKGEILVEKLKKENATLKEKLSGKDTQIRTLKKELKSKPVGASKSVEHY